MSIRLETSVIQRTIFVKPSPMNVRPMRTVMVREFLELVMLILLLLMNKLIVSSVSQMDCTTNVNQVMRLSSFQSKITD